MNKKTYSNLLKILIAIFAFITIVTMFRAIPSIRDEGIRMYPEIALLLFLIGLAIIVHLLLLYDDNKTYTLSFLKGLKTLVGLCILAVVIIITTFVYLRRLGSPGPGIAIMLIVITLGILVVGTVILLIKSIVEEAMKFKEDSDFTI